MSTRRKTPKPGAQGESFSLAEELIASPTQPMPAADAAERVRIARQHLEQIQTAPKPTVMNWRVCAMVGNVMELMIELGYIEDPDGLLMDGQAALKRTAERAIDKDVPIRFSGDDLFVVTDMLDGFEDILATMPHRKVIRSFRETDKRMRQLNLGQRRPGDYIAASRRA